MHLRSGSRSGLVGSSSSFLGSSGLSMEQVGKLPALLVLSKCAVGRSRYIIIISGVSGTDTLHQDHGCAVCCLLPAACCLLMIAVTSCLSFCLRAFLAGPAVARFSLRCVHGGLWVLCARMVWRMLLGLLGAFTPARLYGGAARACVLCPAQYFISEHSRRLTIHPHARTHARRSASQNGASSTAIRRSGLIQQCSRPPRQSRPNRSQSRRNPKTRRPSEVMRARGLADSTACGTLSWYAG